MEQNLCLFCMNPLQADGCCSVCGKRAEDYIASPHHLPPYTLLAGRYQVGRVLGEGGFGITYIGFDRLLELRVAIKEYFPVDHVTRHTGISLELSHLSGRVGASFETGLRRFLQEARSMARMTKQLEIVSIRDYFEANGTAYIVMEYVEGTTLSDLIAQRGEPIPPEELFPVIEPLFHALDMLHQKGLIHRDISPDNLMLEDGAIRLLDFGCAREAVAGTQTMTVTVKHGYAPMEQYMHDGQGPWTDVYALSATIYYCLTGRKPPQSLERLGDDTLIPPRRLGVALTEGQEKALLFGMGVRVRRRFQTVSDLHDALYASVPVQNEEDTPIPEQPVRPEPQFIEHEFQIDPFRPEPPEVDEPQEPKPIIPDPPAKEKKKASGKASKKEIRELLLTVFGAILIIALLIAGFRAFSQAKDRDQTNDPGSDEAATEQQDEKPEQIVFLAEDSREAFYELLADPESTTIQLEEGIYLLLDEPLTLEKSLIVPQGSTLEIRDQVTVADGVRLHVEGSLLHRGILQVHSDGLLELTDSAMLDHSGLLWFHDEDSFSHPEELWLSDYQILIGSEESLFADALHYTEETAATFSEEWATASAIVFDQDYTIPEAMQITCPVLVSEGVTLTLATSTTATPNTLTLEGVPLINYGTVVGRIALQNPEDSDHTAQFLNFGVLDVDGGFFVYSRTALFNFGQFQQSMHIMQYHDSLIYNSGVYTVNEAYSRLQLRSYGRLVNLGSFAVQQLELSGTSDFMNLPDAVLTVTDSADHWVKNLGLFMNEGAVELPEEASFRNIGVLRNAGSVYRFDETSVENEGIILYTNESSPLPPAEDGAAFRFRDWAADHPVQDVSTADELFNVMYSGDYAAARIVNDIVLPSGLEVRLPLLIESGVQLTMSGGTLSLSNNIILENHGTILCGGIQINMSDLINYGSITVSDSRKGVELANYGALIQYGQFQAVGALTLSGSSKAYLEGETEGFHSIIADGDSTVVSRHHIHLADGELHLTDGHVIFQNGLYAENMDVHSWGDSNLVFSAETEFRDSSITLEEDFHFDCISAPLSLTGSTKLTGKNEGPQGLFQFEGWEPFTPMVVEGDLNLQFSSSFYNCGLEMHGKLTQNSVYSLLYSGETRVYLYPDASYEYPDEYVAMPVTNVE